MTKPRTGDYVKLILEDEEFTGILMPRADILEDDITILKLDNGYNIGIKQNRIKKIELIKIYEAKAPAKKASKKTSGLPDVTIISLGGTISSKIDYRTGGVYADYTAEDFIEMCPELKETANLKAVKAMSIMSEDLNPSLWKKIAASIMSELESCDGVVVTQGTDTLHYTTSAMSFMLKDLNKPVIFTASQKSIDRGSSDAFMNLICAVNAAANMDFAGVATCMHGTTDDSHCIIIRGTKVRKMHTSRRDAFRPVNELPLAEVGSDGNIKIINDCFRKKSESGGLSPKLSDSFEEKTALILVYPGMDSGVIDYYVSKGYKGIVLAATALGHVPTLDSKHLGKDNKDNNSSNKNMLPAIENAIKKGIAVVIVSQTLYGRTHPFVYSNLRKLSIGLGCIFAEDMTPETAYVKLGWALGQTKEMEEVRKMMLEDVSGEINQRHNPESFLY